MSDSLLTLYPATTPKAAIVLAHGAGGGQKTPFMVKCGRGFAARGISAATFDFPYMKVRRSVPDRPPVLEQSWREAVDAAKQAFGSLPLFIGGKSMGGRISSHIASQGCDGIAGLVFLGYPLHAPGKPDHRRDAHLPAISEPMLFVQGSRDAFGTSAEIAALLPSLQRATLHTVAGGDHSFKVLGRKDDGSAQLEEILDSVVSWMESIA
jgi:predicted alpha/beta-hydrolase family hydrolase